MLEGTEKTVRMPPLYFNCGGTLRLRQEARYLEQTYATQIEGWLEIYAGWPHHGGAHFHISCAGDERRDKASKNTSTPLQTAGSARISPSQAIMSHRPRPKSCMMETSHNAVQRLARYWRAGLTRGSDGKLTRSDNSSTRSQTLRLYAAALHPPSSSPAGSALRFTLQPERRITSTLVSGSPPPPVSLFYHEDAGSVTFYYTWVIRKLVRKKIWSSSLQLCIISLFHLSSRGDALERWGLNDKM